MIFEGIEGDLNLTPLYKELNVKYFGGSLPNCKCKWNGKLKKCVGRAMVTYKGTTKSNSLLYKFGIQRDAEPSNVELDYNSMRIDMSTGYDLTEDDLKSVMLHEMAHILLYSLKIVTEHHGTPKFINEINRLRSESGLHIVYKESEYKPSPKLQAKPRVIVLYTLADGKQGVALYSINFVKNDINEFNKNILKTISRSSKVREAEYYLFTTSMFYTFAVLRNLKGISWYNVSDDQAKEVRDHGKKFGYCNKTESQIDPSVLGLSTEDVEIQAKERGY